MQENASFTQSIELTPNLASSIYNRKKVVNEKKHLLTKWVEFISYCKVNHSPQCILHNTKVDKVYFTTTKTRMLSVFWHAMSPEMNSWS